MTARKTIVAIFLGAFLLSCTEPSEPKELGSITATLPDIDGALKRIYLGDDTYSDVQRGRTTPLTTLVDNPAGATAWLSAYNRTLKEDAGRRSALLFLAGNACLDALVEPLAAIVEEEQHMEFAAVESCQGEAPPDIPLAPFAVKAIGEITGKQCAELGSDSQNVDLGISLLANWVKRGHNGVHLKAAEQLLRHQPTHATRLRPELDARRSILLEPLEHRRFEPYVDDSGPRPPTAETLARYDECDPQREYSSACEPPYDFALDPGRGDTFVQERIASIASQGGEDCVASSSRYHYEVGFQYNTWDDGFGVGDSCNPEKPYARAMNAVWLLEQSSFNNPPGDYSDGVIHWAYDYVKSVTPEIEANCSEGAMATYTGGGWCDLWPWCDERIVLRANFHRVSLPVRAAGLLHEARHAGGYDHDAGDDCPRGGSCDSEYSYRGANTISVQWAAQFVRIGRHSTALMRESALTYANHVLHKRYRRCSTFSLNEAGWFHETGETSCD